MRRSFLTNIYLVATIFRSSQNWWSIVSYRPLTVPWLLYGSIARKGKFSNDGVEFGHHVPHRLEPACISPHDSDQSAYILHEGGQTALYPMGKTLSDCTLTIKAAHPTIQMKHLSALASLAPKPTIRNSFSASSSSLRS